MVRRKIILVPLTLAATLAGAATRIVQDQCGPFTDVSPAICPYVLEMNYLGITAGTSPTTYSPDATVTRGQAAVFVSKGVNQAIARSSRRAALGQWWTTTPHWDVGLGVTQVGSNAWRTASDGSDIWVTTGSSVARVRSSDGRIVETWTDATNSSGVLAAMGRVFAAGQSGTEGQLFMIDPSQPAGAVTVVVPDLGGTPGDLAFDGSRIWTSNFDGSVSIVTPGTSIPWAVTKISEGFTTPNGIAFAEAHIWVSDAGRLFRLDDAGAIIQTIPIGAWSDSVIFDGANLWIPTGYPDNAVVVVSSDTGAIRATLTGNGLNGPSAGAFDGERVLITSGDTISIWRAADLAPLGFHVLGPGLIPSGACSDGVNFWIALNPNGQLGRF